jgi:Mannose-6-phosphate receptor
VALPEEEVGLSAGATFLVIFGSLFAAYLFGGMAIMKFIKGAQGVEVIPNYEFWAGLPSLVKVLIIYLILCFPSLNCFHCFAGWFSVHHIWVQR